MTRVTIRPLGRPSCHQDPRTSTPPALSTFVNKTKRLSLISAQDYFFGNPTEDPARNTTAPVFSLQRDFSGYYDCPDSQNDCTQADGSGYYVVPAGVILAEPKPAWFALKPDKPTPWTIHRAFSFAFVDNAFIGEKWHAAAAFKWLGVGSALKRLLRPPNFFSF